MYELEKISTKLNNKDSYIYRNLRVFYCSLANKIYEKYFSAYPAEKQKEFASSVIDYATKFDTYNELAIRIMTVHFDDIFQDVKIEDLENAINYFNNLIVDFQHSVKC